MRRLAFVSLLFVGATAGAFDLISVQKTPSAADDAQAKTFQPDPAVARVYAYRDNGLLGKTLKSHLVIGHKVAATTGSDEFAVVNLPAGDYDLECVSANEKNAAVGLFHNKASKAPLHLTAEAGKIYFLHEAFKGSKGFLLETVDQPTAEPVIRKGRLAQEVEWK